MITLITTPPKPPELLSDLIALALAAADKCAADPRYKLDMTFWHLPNRDVCFVCLAGAVMSQILGADPNVTVVPDNCPPEWRKSLMALNYIIDGLLSHACETFGVKWSGPYWVNNASRDWRRNAEECMRLLREAGL
jgi:hypothetical protein